MLAVIIIAIVAGLISSSMATVYYWKHPSDGTHSYGFVWDPFQIALIGGVFFTMTLLLGYLVLVIAEGIARIQY